MTALAVAAYSLRSGWAAAGWGVLVVFLTLGQLGELLRLPRWLVQVSPYTHAPRMPVESFALAPTAGLTMVTVVLLALGWLAYRRRDIG